MTIEEVLNRVLECARTHQHSQILAELIEDEIVQIKEEIKLNKILERDE